MNNEPQKLLWTQDLPEPCLRMKFRLMLSINDLEVELYQQREIIERWRKRGQERFIERCKELGLKPEHYRFKHEYKYRGKLRYKWKEGERLKECFFNEKTLLIVRFWKSNEIPFDLDNLHLKPVIDGMVDARLMPDDNVNYISDIYRKYEGIDKAFALSKEETDARSRIKKGWELRGLKKTLPPPPNKMIFLDFYRISRIISEKIKFFTFHD